MHREASPSMPQRKSTGRQASRILICGTIWIKAYRERRNWVQSVVIVEASKAERTKVRREPSERSICKRQSEGRGEEPATAIAAQPPMPLLAPVTRATRPVRSCFFISGSPLWT